MSEKLKSTHELECQEKIQALNEQIKTTQIEIAQVQKELSEEAAIRILGKNPFGHVYLNTKRKRGECYSILSSADWSVNIHGEESVCMRGLDIINDAGLISIEETYEEIYNSDKFDEIFKALTDEEYYHFADKYKWMLIPIEKFLKDFKYRV